MKEKRVMTVKELIKQLSKFPKNMEVVVWADNGETNLKCGELDTVYIPENEWENTMMDDTHPDDFEAGVNYKEVCQIYV